MARMVCLWLPNWPLQRLRHERAELKGRAVVLFSTTGNRGPRVVSCSPAPTQQGVAAGMPLAEAQALMVRDSAANTHFEPHDPAADIAALRKVAQTCDRFSPVFGIEESDAPDCALLDIAGCSHLFGGEQNLADAITNQFRQQGFQVRVGIAPTVGAAWAVAHCLAKSHHQPVLADGELATALAPLPVTALRLPFKIVETLHELGLRSIGQLRTLPRESLPSRFGPELLKRLDQAFGDSPELLVAECPAEPIAVTWVTEESLTDREALKLVCRELADEMIRQLKPRREGVRQLRFIRLKHLLGWKNVDMPFSLGVDETFLEQTTQHVHSRFVSRVRSSWLPA